MVDVIARYKILGGTGRLVDGFVSDIRGEVRTGVRATSIVERDDHVEVTLGDGSAVQAGAVVVAVPINVLSEIKLEPARPEFNQIAKNGVISRGLKVICRIRGDRAPYMAFAPEGNPLVLVQYDRSIDGDHIAVGFGPDATALDATSPEAVQEVLRGWLPDVEVVEVANHNWATDDMFRGTWAVPAPGQLRAQLDAVAARGRVLLAGADLASGSYALIDGAISTGVRAGRDAAALTAPH
jgi:monoamine oxidase